MFRRLRISRPLLFAAASGLLAAPGGVAAQEPDTGAMTSLVTIAERATKAAVLIDVETTSGSRQGSGFIVESDGLILTNYHVVRGARSARVRLSSGDVYDRVTILAEDARRDLAVLAIRGFELPTLSLGNSDSVRVGTPVVLIGSPLGLENTVSTGIVSGRRQEPEGFQLLQVTAPASQGSSGGAVLSSAGEVVGVAVSQLLSGQNLNFAVPINYARGILHNLDRSQGVVLETAGEAAEDSTPTAMANAKLANAGMHFDFGSVAGYSAAWTARLGDGRERHQRVTYQVIETVGGAPTRIERYLESETTRRTEPFGTRQTVRRERIRSIVERDGLRPLSSRGEIAWWTDQGWKTAQHDVRFDGDRVLGTVVDSAGNIVDLDRSVPEGTLLRDLRELAFATLEVDSLAGRSVEFESLDPWTGEITKDRYDVIGHDTIEVAGEERSVLRVNVAAGLDNETVFFDRTRPRVPFRRIGESGSLVEGIVCLDVRRQAGSGAASEPRITETVWCLQPHGG